MSVRCLTHTSDAICRPFELVSVSLPLQFIHTVTYTALRYNQQRIQGTSYIANYILSYTNYYYVIGIQYTQYCNVVDNHVENDSYMLDLLYMAICYIPFYDIILPSVRHFIHMALSPGRAASRRTEPGGEGASALAQGAPRADRPVVRATHDTGRPARVEGVRSRLLRRSAGRPCARPPVRPSDGARSQSRRSSRGAVGESESVAQRPLALSHWALAHWVLVHWARRPRAAS